MVFKTLDIWKWRTVISERQETNKVSPTTAPVYYLERVFSFWHKEEIQAEPRRLPELRRWSWEFRETKADRIHRTEYWEERLTDRGLWRAAQGFGQHTHEEVIQDQGKNPPKGLALLHLWVTRGSKMKSKEIIKYLELNENKNTSY